MSSQNSNEKKKAVTYPSSNERPSPAPTKNPLVKKGAGKQKEKKSFVGQEKSR